MFKNREEAGLLLVKELGKYKGRDGIVYALPRGGVVLGYQIAEKLDLPLDLVITRKIGHPFNPEYAICAISESGRLVCNEEERKVVNKVWLEKKIKTEQKEAWRRRETYKPNKLSATNKIAIIVDDGVATGLTMFAAIEEILDQKPKKIIVAVPIIPPDTAQKIRQKVDELIALEIPDFFAGAVGAYYENFPQVSDEEVMKLIKKSNHQP